MSRSERSTITPCRFFRWRLFRREGVYYSDCRGGKYKLGKHSLGTRDRAEALQRLNQLDVQKAFEIGLCKEQPLEVIGATSIVDGWKDYLDFAGRSPV